jgi:hypothetical protein
VSFLHQRGGLFLDGRDFAGAHGFHNAQLILPAGAERSGRHLVRMPAAQMFPGTSSPGTSFPAHHAQPARVEPELLQCAHTLLALYSGHSRWIAIENHHRQDDAGGVDVFLQEEVITAV